MKKHRGPLYAIFLARALNYRKPLIDRLRDDTVPLDQRERDFLADVLEGQVNLTESSER